MNRSDVEFYQTAIRQNLIGHLKYICASDASSVKITIEERLRLVEECQLSNDFLGRNKGLIFQTANQP